MEQHVFFLSKSLQRLKRVLRNILYRVNIQCVTEQVISRVTSSTEPVFSMHTRPAGYGTLRSLLSLNMFAQIVEVYSETG